MDLSAMAFKLDNGHYSSRSVFQSDFKLIVSNAKVYNQAGSYVYAEAETLDEFFDKSKNQVTEIIQSTLIEVFVQLGKN
jgi:transcription initiation factor TFIID subunit 2